MSTVDYILSKHTHTHQNAYYSQQDMIFLGKRKFYIALIRNPPKLSTRFSSFASNSKKQQLYMSNYASEKFQYLSQNFPLSFLPPIHHLIISINNVQHLHSNVTLAQPVNHWNPRVSPPMEPTSTNQRTNETNLLFSGIGVGSVGHGLRLQLTGDPWKPEICQLFGEHVVWAPKKHPFNAGRSEDLTY